MIQDIEEVRVGSRRRTSSFYRRSFDVAFILDEKALRRLNDIAAEVSETTDYLVTLQSGIAFTLDNIDAVVHMQNPEGNSIRSIEVRTPASRELGLEVRTTNEKGQCSGYWRVFSAFGESDTSYFSKQLDAWVASITPRYSRIATLNFTLTFFGALFAAFLGLLGVTLIPTDVGAPIENGHVFAQRELSELLGSAIWLAPVLLAIPSDYVRSRLFPKATFAIGLGLHRYQRTRLWRSAFAIGAGTALVVSLLVALSFAL